MVYPITNLTKADVQRLRRKNYGTNNIAVEVSSKEVDDMQHHLETLFTEGRVQLSFAEKIAIKNKAY